MKPMNLTDLSSFLSEKSIKPSFQRIKILNYLIHNHIHPTVNDIYDNLISEIPSLSKTTIYNTLNIFAKNKIVKEINIEENELRYDINTHEHGHFKCIECQKVFDFDIAFEDSAKKSLDGFELLECEMNIKGLCKTCKNSN